MCVEGRGAHVHVCACAYVYVGICRLVSKPEAKSGYCFSGMLTLRQAFIGLELVKKDSYLATTSQRITSLCLPSTEITGISHRILLFCVGTRNLPRVLILASGHFTNYDFSSALIISNNYFFVSFHLSCLYPLNVKILRC